MGRFRLKKRIRILPPSKIGQEPRLKEKNDSFFPGLITVRDNCCIVQLQVQLLRVFDEEGGYVSLSKLEWISKKLQEYFKVFMYFSIVLVKF